MSRTAYVVTGVIVFVIFIILLLFFNSRRNQVIVVPPPPAPTPVPTSTPTPTFTPTPSPTPTLIPTPTVTSTPTPIPIPSANIIVNIPQPGDIVGRPMRIIGQARTFEQAVNFRIIQDDGRVLTEAFVIAKAIDTGQYGPFDVFIDYPRPTRSDGTLEVFQSSPRDGGEIDKVIIRIKFTDIQ